MRASLIAITTAAFTSLAGANTVVEALMRGQVTVAMKDGNIDGCGVTVMALESAKVPSGNLRIFNGSFALYTLGGGLVKGQASEVDTKLLLEQPAEAMNRVKPSPTEHFWFKTAEKPATTLADGQRYLKSDDPGYLLYAAKFDTLFGLLDSVIEKKPIQVGLKVKGRSVGEVLYGVVQMSESDTNQLVQCIGEWSTTQRKKHGIN